MKKQFIGILATILILATLLSGCGNAEPASSSPSPTETEAGSENAGQLTESPEPTETPETIDTEYGIVSSTNFEVSQDDLDADNIFNDSGIAWLIITDEETSKEYNAIVNTCGEVIYLSDPLDFGNPSAQDVTTTAFVNGLSTIYAPGKPGFKIVNESGKEVYESNDENVYMCRHMRDGNFLLIEHESGFDHDNWVVYVLDSDLNLRNTGVNDPGTLYKDDVTMISENLYHTKDSVLNEYAAKEHILNLEKNVCFALPGSYIYHNDQVLYFKYNSDLYTIPLETLKTAESEEMILNLSTLVMEGNWCWSLHHKWVSNENEFSSYRGGCVYTYWYDDEQDKMLYGYKDFNGNIIMTYPEFNSGVSIVKHETFSGGYSAIYMRGADDNRYASIVNEQGEIQYEPKQIAGQSFSDDFASCSHNGYIFTRNMILAPDGTEKHLGDDLTGLANTELLYDEWDDAGGYAVAIGGGYIIEKTIGQITICSLDGTKKIDKFTANYNSDGNLIYTDQNREKHVSGTAYEGESNGSASSDGTQMEHTSKNYISVDDFSIEGKWKNVGETTWGQAQTGAIIVFDGKNCNYFSPNDTYAFYMDGDDYKLDCTSPLGDTISSTVKIVDDNNIDIYSGSTVIELTRVG